MEKMIAIDGSTTKTGIAVFNLNSKKLCMHTVIAPDNIVKPLSKKRQKRINENSAKNQAETDKERKYRLPHI